MDADLDVQDSKEETVSLEGVLWKKLIFCFLFFFVEVRQVEILLLMPIIIIQTKIKITEPFVEEQEISCS